MKKNNPSGKKSAAVTLTIVLATNNANKAREIKAIFADDNIEFLTLDQLPGAPNIIEDQPTMEGNAKKKAFEIARWSKRIALADDSGLEVAFLHGAPGVFSARFAGPKCSFDDNNQKLLNLLKGIPTEHRKARFRCVMCLATPGGATWIEQGSLEGFITDRPRGAEGFGYDPIFLVPDAGKTLAEMIPSDKNAISHRFLALQAIRPIILKLRT